MPSIDQLAKDEVRLSKAVSDLATAFNAVAEVIATDAATIADLKAQIAALSIVQPDLDLTSLEASITLLQDSNVKLNGLVPSAMPAAAPVDTPPAS